MAILPPLVAVEIGTSKVRAIVAEAREDGHLMITGIGEQGSRGIRKGEIVHFDNALTCLKAALNEAATQSRVTVHEVNVVLTGGHIKSSINRGSVPIMARGAEITSDDIENATDTAKALSLADDREIVHSIQQRFYVDEEHAVMDPEGMEGTKLGVDMLIIHGLRTRLRNLVRLVKSANVEVENRAFSGLCSAQAVLTPEQKESGAMVIDFGGGTTDFFVYSNQTVAMAGTFAVGGDHVTNDLALGLRMPTSQAEYIKLNYGSAMIEPSLKGKSVAIPPEAGFTGGQVQLTDVQSIVHARMDETLDMIRDALAPHDILHGLGAGVIITGGGARMRRLPELVSNKFSVPCALGKPRNVSGVAVVTEGTEYAAVIGQLRFAEKTARKGTSKDFLFSWMRGLMGK